MAGMDADAAARDAEWLALVAPSAIGRLATQRRGGLVDLIPFVFAWLPEPEPLGRLVSAVDHKPKRHQRLQRLANIALHPEVTVLVDHYEDDWSRLWWVRVRGVATEQPDRAGLLALCEKYQQYRERPPDGPMLRIAVTSVQGWSGGPIPDLRRPKG
jgi:PPOX class probable F420-dependent enzyme